MLLYLWKIIVHNFYLVAVFSRTQLPKKLEAIIRIKSLWGPYKIFSRCPWCNSYRRRKWTGRLEFKILDEADFISHSTSTLEKGMNPIILPPAKGK